MTMNRSHRREGGQTDAKGTSLSFVAGILVGAGLIAPILLSSSANLDELRRMLTEPMVLTLIGGTAIIVILSVGIVLLYMLFAQFE